ncbi:cylicin-1-like [Drosophila biarmipes]|uniref:cylicin-1-like n=1 Tax=Drosophila biarmipes TaxID=125945 RepID=UPI0021CD0889|nr:cylicin-1-like [Drosophila biarmipes]XP_050745698.1 cylicin-1-like [Drosophila biarmipes]XP_050745699.1 cylicin-1-like [Drosophila biarmipes]
MDTSGGGRRVGQGTSFVKGGRAVRSKVGPKIRRTLPGHRFCVTSNLQNTVREHKKRENHPRERAEIRTNTEHIRPATSRYVRQKATIKCQRVSKDTTKGSKDSSKDTQRTRGEGSKDSSKETQRTQGKGSKDSPKDTQRTRRKGSKDNSKDTKGHNEKGPRIAPRIHKGHEEKGPKIAPRIPKGHEEKGPRIAPRIPEGSEEKGPRIAPRMAKGYKEKSPRIISRMLRNTRKEPNDSSKDSQRTQTKGSRDNSKENLGRREYKDISREGKKKKQLGDGKDNHQTGTSKRSEMTERKISSVSPPKEGEDGTDQRAVP